MTSASVSDPINDGADGSSALAAPRDAAASSDSVEAPALRDPLYQAISDFSFDRGDEELTFRGRLARENMWTLEFAALACIEYKKFMYLVCTSDEMLTPSEAVDAVWHQHLVYSESYWIEFCGGVLKRQIHHHPTKGGGLEEIRYRRCYQATLERYYAAFDTWPDLVFWPSVDVRFAAAGRTRTVSINEYYIIPRKEAIFVLINVAVLCLAIVSFWSGLIPKAYIVLYPIVHGIFLLHKLTNGFQFSNAKSRIELEGGGCGGCG